MRKREQKGVKLSINVLLAPVYEPVLTARYSLGCLRFSHIYHTFWLEREAKGAGNRGFGGSREVQKGEKQ